MTRHKHKPQQKPRGARPSTGTARRENQGVHKKVQKKRRPRRCGDHGPTRRRSDVASVPAASSTKTKRCKRRRTSESEPTDKQAKHSRTDKLALRKHERFWFADGNAIVELDGIRFRVHQSWLTKHSAHMAGILLGVEKGPNSKPEDTIIEFGRSESQLVLKAIDFEALLLLYENPGNYRNTIEPSTLMSLIRATTLLGFDSDYEWLVKELKALWPSNLEELVANTEPRLDAPEVAALARACDIDGLLKPAFYDMARTPKFGPGKVEESDVINRADMLRLFQMREYLSGMWAQVAAHEDPTSVCQSPRAVPSSDDEGTSSPSENVDTKPACGSTTPASMASNCLSATARCLAWVRLVHSSEIFTRYRYDPLCGIAALINIEWTGDWCKDCQEQRRAGWRKVQRSIWEKIDEYLRDG
ncbi:hypothetical protein DEU56DRAFT_809346 [Suillus clintonianus]|uniref:uncharacterized protein n=1 Tax=Suillus clintonianus TaxID=1904413 RepID=UPI001B871F24|nr:uncharacterized protein DEU56DRAFT_809346 [Suillus clintonianus]KAG2134488.1 hypothetical protein DEU56DRAFT_809346 [Suillus clintonianus]